MAQLIVSLFYTLAGVKMELPEVRPEERTPLVEALLGIIRHLLDVVGQQEQAIQELRDEIEIVCDLYTQQAVDVGIRKFIESDSLMPYLP